jgi:hypothetical protein
MEIAPLSSRNVSRIDKRLHLPWKSPRCCGRARYAHGQRLWAEDGRSSEQWIQWTGSFNSTHNNNEDCVKQFKVYEFHRSRYMKWYKSSWSNVIDWSQTYRFPYSAKLSHYTKVTSAIETYSNNLPTTCLQLPHGQFLGKYRLCSFIHSERFAVHGFAFPVKISHVEAQISGSNTQIVLLSLCMCQDCVHLCTSETVACIFVSQLVPLSITLRSSGNLIFHRKRITYNIFVVRSETTMVAPNIYTSLSSDRRW